MSDTYLRHFTDSTTIPHHRNIFQILELHPIVQVLIWENPTLAGGFPLALFAAPRVGKPPGLISRAYYTDIDIYPEDNEQRARIANIINTEFGTHGQIIKKHVTERATTYTIKIVNACNKESIYNVQLMSMPELEGPIENIFSTYDFTNCVIAMKPQTKEIYMHKDLVYWHKAKELELFKPHCFDANSPEEDIIIQLLRIHKYCTRWGYNLSENTLNKLMAVYTAQPDIKLVPNKNYKMNSGKQKGLITNSTANIWKLMSNLITSSRYWKTELDVHGDIANVNSQEPIDISAIFNEL